MQTIAMGAQGLGLLVRLNWDRLLFLATIWFCLAMSAYFYSL